MRDPLRRRAAVEQALVAFGLEAGDPLPRRALTDPGGRGRLRHPPLLIEDPRDEQFAALRTGPGITVELHSVSSLGLGGFSTAQPSKEARMNNVVRSYS